jgi:hypothetical protein
MSSIFIWKSFELTLLPSAYFMSSQAAASGEGFAACCQQCLGGIWQKIKEGRRKTQARWICAISIIGCSFVAITSVTSGCVPTILIAVCDFLTLPLFSCFMRHFSFLRLQFYVVRHCPRRASLLFGMDTIRQGLVCVCCALFGAVLGPILSLHRVRAGFL